MGLFGGGGISGVIKAITQPATTAASALGVKDKTVLKATDIWGSSVNPASSAYQILGGDMKSPTAQALLEPWRLYDTFNKKDGGAGPMPETPDYEATRQEELELARQRRAALEKEGYGGTLLGGGYGGANPQQRKLLGG